MHWAFGLTILDLGTWSSAGERFWNTSLSLRACLGPLSDASLPLLRPSFSLTRLKIPMPTRAQETNLRRFSAGTIFGVWCLSFLPIPRATHGIKFSPSQSTLRHDADQARHIHTPAQILLRQACRPTRDLRTATFVPISSSLEERHSEISVLYRHILRAQWRRRSHIRLRSCAANVHSRGGAVVTFGRDRYLARGGPQGCFVRLRIGSLARLKNVPTMTAVSFAVRA